MCDIAPFLCGIAKAMLMQKRFKVSGFFCFKSVLKLFHFVHNCLVDRRKANMMFSILLVIVIPLSKHIIVNYKEVS